MNKIKFKIGEYIIKEGEGNRGAFRILSGEAQVLKLGLSSNVRLATLKKDDVFGEISLIDNEPYSASVKAITDIECLIIDPVKYVAELKMAGPVLTEVIKTFTKRLRDSGDIARILLESKSKHKKNAQHNLEESEVLAHVAGSAAKLQEIYIWDDAVCSIKESLYVLGYDNINIEIFENDIENIEDSSIKEIGGTKILNIPFQAGNDRGLLTFSLNESSTSTDDTRIIRIYKSLLSSCLLKCKSFEAFNNISNELDAYMKDSNISTIIEDLKTSINNFSTSTVDNIMTIPEKLKAGENIEDISFELTIGFQEIDRLSQEIDMINQVYSNVKRISLGQIPKTEGRDKNLHQKGDQDDIDALINSLK